MMIILQKLSVWFNHILNWSYNQKVGVNLSFVNQFISSTIVSSNYFTRTGESWEHLNGFQKKKNFLDNINQLLPLSNGQDRQRRPEISLPEDFRQVSSIIDVDVVPDTCRRVRLVKHGSNKPLGFYIRDGTSVRVTPKGLEKGPAIFISRLVPGGEFFVELILEKLIHNFSIDSMLISSKQVWPNRPDY